MRFIPPRHSFIRWPLACCAAVFALALAGCGGSDGAGTTTSTGSSKPQSSATSSDTAVTGDTSEVRYAP